MHLKKKSEEDLERAELEWAKTVEHYTFQFAALSSEYKLLEKYPWMEIMTGQIEVNADLRREIGEAYRVVGYIAESEHVSHSEGKAVEDFIVKIRSRKKRAAKVVSKGQCPKCEQPAKGTLKKELDHLQWLDANLTLTEEGNYYWGKNGGKAILEIDLLSPLSIINKEVSRIIEAKKKELYSEDPKLELLGKSLKKGGRSLKTMVPLWDRRLRALELKDSQRKTYNEIAEIIYRETGETVTYHNARDYVLMGRKDVEAVLSKAFPRQ